MRAAFELAGRDQCLSLEGDDYQSLLVDSSGAQMHYSAIGLGFGHSHAEDFGIDRKRVARISCVRKLQADVGQVSYSLLRNIVNGEAQRQVEQHQRRDYSIA